MYPVHLCLSVRRARARLRLAWPEAWHARGMSIISLPDGQELFYELQGTGSPLLLIMGTGAPHLGHFSVTLVGGIAREALEVRSSTPTTRLQSIEIC